MKISKPFAIAVLLAGTAASAGAQTSSVTIYGAIDQYLNYMHSSSGAKVKSLEDGDWLRSRIGFRGVEDLGGGLFAKFQVEGGFNTDTGAINDTANNRFFDRQTWVGIGTTEIGEFRLGRQNGPIQTRGGYIDYTARNLGSVVNAFGVPSRYDNDMSYISPRWSGLQVEGHLALPEASVGNRALIYQGALDYVIQDFRVGYIGLRGRPATNAVINKDVVYDNLYGNWNYGKGTVYLAYVRSNNRTNTAVSKTGAAILSNTGGGGAAGALTNSAYNTGANADLRNFYNVYQISADYLVTPALRVGALWGKIDDKSGRSQGATGGSVGMFYDLSKRTMLLAQVDTLRNSTNGGWLPAASGALKTTFTTANDINGRTINGMHLGIVHRF